MCKSTKALWLIPFFTLSLSAGCDVSPDAITGGDEVADGEEFIEVDDDSPADAPINLNTERTRVNNVLASLNSALAHSRLKRKPATTNVLKTALARLALIKTPDDLIAEARADVAVAQQLVAQAAPDFVAVESAIEVAWSEVHESPIYRATHGASLSFGKTARLKSSNGDAPWVKVNVGDYKGSFRALTLRAKDNPANIYHVRAYHSDGTFEEVPLGTVSMIREGKYATLQLQQPGPIEVVKIQAGSGFVNWDHAYLEVSGVEVR